MNVFLLEHSLYVCSFMYACPCVHVFGFWMYATLSNSVYTCVSIHVTFKSIGVRVSFMSLNGLNLSSTRLPEAGFFLV